MKQFKVKFVREFEVGVEAEDAVHAKSLADEIVKQFPADTCRLLSVIDDAYVEGECGGCAVDPHKPYGKPKGPKPDPSGGSPSTPVMKVPMLVDQVAQAA